MLFKDVTFVHPAFHEVPCDAVFWLFVNPRPNWRIQSSVVGQNAIVKIHSAFTCKRQYIVRNYGQIGEAKNPVDI